MDTEVLEKLREKAGGDFRLVTLFESRLRDLMRGLPPLVEKSAGGPWDVATQEILRNKIALVSGKEAARMRKDLEKEEPTAVRPEPAQPPARKRRREASTDAA